MIAIICCYDTLSLAIFIVMQIFFLFRDIAWTIDDGNYFRFELNSNGIPSNHTFSPKSDFVVYIGRHFYKCPVILSETQSDGSRD